MKIKIVCHFCSTDVSNSGSVKYVLIEIDNNGYYKTMCDKRHIINCFISNRKHELLFDFGLLAYNEGNYREAVFNVASALERFYEYNAIILLLNANIKYDEIIKTWKKLDNQSERQYGGYILLNLLENGNLPNLPSESNASFRNKVIHKGYFPSKTETEGYINEIGSYLIKQQKILVNKYFSLIMNETIERNQALMKKNNISNGASMVMIIPTYLQMQCQKPRELFNLNEALVNVVSYKNNVYESSNIIS